MKHKVDVGLACGRYYLSVNGFVAAMEGDMCRDSTLPGSHWTKELLESVATGSKAMMQKEYEAGKPFSSITDIDAEVKYTAAKKKDREEFDRRTEDMLKNTFAAVEATSNERHQLWLEWSTEGRSLRPQDPLDKRMVVHWEQVGFGLIQEIGAFTVGKERMPVMFSCFWQKLRINSGTPQKTVMFWEMVSQVTDSRMADQFLKENLPKDFISTNANNFHNVVFNLKG